MNAVGVLSENLKSAIFKNLKELSTIEGNIASFASDKQPIKTILVTSCSPLEGKTVSSISMALALSIEANAKVVLIEGNISSPRIHELFNIDTVPGLSDLLISRANLNETMRKTEFKNLTIIPSGSDISKKLDVFETERLQDLLGSLKKDFDYVIVDGQSVSGSSDVSIVSKYFDGIVFVVECEKTRWEVLQQSKEKIKGVGGKILGVVLNKRIYYIPEKLYGKI
jgi:capsular exopolysaccharide synthesis family protein